MTDIVVALEAADVLSLAGSFIPQGATLTTDQAHAQMIKANGDFQKFSAVYGVTVNGTASYKFSADAGLGAALSSLCGSIANSYMITEITVDTDKEDWPTIGFTFHQHTNNTHTAGNVYDIPADMVTIITGAFGAYDFAGKVSATVAVNSSTYRIGLDHIDDEDHQGNHWVGTNTKGIEEQTCNYVGNIATPTVISGWTVQSPGTTDSNEAHDTSTVNAVRLVLRN